MAKGKVKRVKVPKEVGGVKVPKKVRKTGDRVLKAAVKHPVVTEIAATALLAAAAALRDKQRTKAVGREAGDKVIRDVAQFKDAIASAARQAMEQLSQALSDAAVEVKPRGPRPKGK